VARQRLDPLRQHPEIEKPDVDQRGD